MRGLGVEGVRLCPQGAKCDLSAPVPRRRLKVLLVPTNGRERSCPPSSLVTNPAAEHMLGAVLFFYSHLFGPVCGKHWNGPC